MPRAWWLVAVLLGGLAAARGEDAAPPPSSAAPPAAAPSDDLPAPIDLKIRDVLWQVLPERVQAAFAGPDGRAWFELSGGGLDVAQVKRLIAREFAKPQPQLVGARPVLFEPGGRVWFAVRAKDKRTLCTLLGYDGRDWTERQAAEKGSFTYNCCGNGNFTGGPYNVAVGGRLFFPDGRGIHCFDGKAWTYQDFESAVPWTRTMFADESQRPKEFIDPSAPRVADLRVMADGKTVVALVARAGLWQWRGEGWSPIVLPEGIEPSRVEGMVAWGKGGLLVRADKGYFFLHLTDDFPPDVAALIRQLGAKDFKDRQAATDALIALGEPVAAWVRQARAKADDPEVLARLEAVLLRLKPAGAATGLRLDLSGYRMQEARIVSETAEGLVFFAGNKVETADGKKYDQALVVADAAGRVRVLTGENAYQAGPAHRFSEVPSAAGGRRVWNHASWPQLHDLDKNEYVDRMPDSGYTLVEAILPDGTIFAGPRDGLPDYGRVAVYRPGRPDDRRLLEGKFVALAPDSSAVFQAKDGRIWAVLDERPDRLQRYDGTTWEVMNYDLGGRAVTDGQEGRGGSMIFMAQDRKGAGKPKVWILFHKGQFFDAPTHEELIEKYTRQVTEGFGPGTRDGWKATVAGKDGVVWILDEQRIKVWTGKTWLDAKAPLAAVGAANRGYWWAASFGDGSRVYVWPHGGDKAFFAGVRNESLVLDPAPSPVGYFSGFLEEDAPDRAFWLCESSAPLGASLDWPEKPVLSRLTEKGKTAELKDSGLPILRDTAGNLWLDRVPGAPPNRYSLWRDGKIAATVTTPSGHLDVGNDGSIFVWSMEGLWRLVADDPAHPTTYKARGPYCITGWWGMETREDVSPLGFANVRWVQRGDKGGMMIYAIPKD
jgi:hypothetical protein